MEAMCCGTEKATKLIAELDSEKGIGLIERKKQGQGKPAIIYLKKFYVEEDSRNSRLSEIESQDLGKSKNKTFENRKSRVSETESAEFRESKGNNTNINNTDFNDTDKIISNPIGESSEADAIRWIEERKSFESVIKENIDYDTIVQEYGKEWLNEIVEIMVDVVCSREPFIRINKEPFPKEIVKNRFLKINGSHIEYINMALKNNTSDVRNIRAFLITTIYRSFETVDNWFSAKVNYDMAQMKT